MPRDWLAGVPPEFRKEYEEWVEGSPVKILYAHYDGDRTLVIASLCEEGERVLSFYRLFLMGRKVHLSRDAEVHLDMEA